LQILEYLQQLQDIQQKRLEKLQLEIVKQAQPSLVASAEEIFEAPRPQLENLADQQQWLVKPIPLVGECLDLYHSSSSIFPDLCCSSSLFFYLI
jgi:hypothetical protein